MKSTQITLLGGQIIPVYWGIKERNPDHVHLIHTEELKDKLRLLKESFASVTFTFHQVDPYDFDDISTKIESIVIDYESDSWELNLTGGTKIMTLAAHNVFKDLGLESFYLDQNKQLYFFKKKTYMSLKGDIRIRTFLKLSGHAKINDTSLSSIERSEFDIALKMLELMSDKDVRTLFRFIASNVEDHTIQSYEKILDQNKFIDWRNDSLKINTSKTHEVIEHKRAFQICFTGLWWELVIAHTVRSWERKKEMLLSVELLTNSGSKMAKNEIDIILNTGKTMVFIECKSGNVKQQDVNKIRAVKRLYGGISSKSILVCLSLPRKDILEKCKDLDIEVFALQRRVNNKNSSDYIPLSDISNLNNKLTELVNKIEV